MQNNSNSNSSSQIQSVAIINQLPPFIDFTVRGFCLLIHVLYFIILASCKDLRKLSFFPMHHACLIGFVTALNYCIWIPWDKPNTGNATLNSILCSLSEVIWALTKYCRCYSIFVLALYRLVAVLWVNLFKKIVNSIRVYLLTTILVWIIPGIVFCIAKFTAQTGPGAQCADGASSSFTNTIIYFSITTVFGQLLPTLSVLVVYVIIRRRLVEMGQKLHSKKPTVTMEHSISDLSNSNHNAPSTQPIGRSEISSSKKRKEKKLAKQFIILNGLEVASCVFLIIVKFSNVNTQLSTTYFFIRQIFRIGALVCISCVPIFSLVYSPVYKRFLRYIKSLF